MSTVRVLYKSSKGVMYFDRRKPVFHHRDSIQQVNIGLGSVDLSSMVDKEKFAFAEITNVYSVFPKSYLTIDHFENIGVPSKMYRGVYGGSVFIKEEYSDKVFIKAFDAEGNLLLQENRRVKNNTSLNMHYCRLDNIIGDWEDITEFVFSNIFESLLSKNCDLNLNSLYVLCALNKLNKNSAVRTANGAVLASGKYETLAIWGNGSRASMAWLGRVVEFDPCYMDMREELDCLMVANGIE